MSQKKLAKLAGTSPATVNDLEHARRTASPTTLRKLAGGLGVEVEEVWEALEIPKATTPPSSGLTSNDALEEERREQEEALAEQRYLIPLLDSYTLLLKELRARYAPFLDNLSRELPPSRSLRVYQRIGELLNTCDAVQRALDEKGVTDIVQSLLDRAHLGKHVPPDLLLRAQALQEEGAKLFGDVWASAYEWVESQRERPDVMAFNEKERQESEKRLAKANGAASDVIAINGRRRQGEKDKSTWKLRAEGAG